MRTIYAEVAKRVFRKWCMDIEIEYAQRIKKKKEHGEHFQAWLDGYKDGIRLAESLIDITPTAHTSRARRNING